MFSKLTKVTVANGYLVDDRNIKYKQEMPVSTVKLKLYGKPYVPETPLKAVVFSRLVRDLAAISPEPNAWLDAGVISEGVEVLELPDIDLDGTISRSAREVEYKLHKFEFYHLGE
jgi:hypothetical protein